MSLSEHAGEDHEDTMSKALYARGARDSHGDREAAVGQPDRRFDRDRAGGLPRPPSRNPISAAAGAAERRGISEPARASPSF